MTEVVGNDHFPWEEIADGNVFETGIYLMEIIKFEDGEASTGTRMPKAQFKCIEPAQFATMVHFENYVVGTEESPKDVVPGTMGARSMKRDLTAAQVPKSNSISEAMASAVGNQLMLQLSKYKEVGGEYDGTPRNRVIGAFKVGERAAGVTADKSKKGPGTGGKASGLSAAPPPGSEASPTMICGACAKAVPKDEYSAHVESCTGGHEEVAAATAQKTDAPSVEA
jgi:hypothetical protein